MPCVRLDILLAGIRLSIWVLIKVDFSRWLIVMLCRFCNTFPKRSDRIFAVSPTTCPLNTLPTVFCITRLSLSP